MHYTYTMIQAFETEKNRKAFIYTAIICALIVILFFLIRWTVLPVSVPVIEDLIEINLGNDEEGFGEEQPLIKGNFTPSQETIVASKQETSNSAPDNKVQPDDNAEEDAAAVVKPVKNNTKIKTETPVKPAPVPTPKPQKPKITYNGPGSGLPGNNPTEDNGYKRRINPAYVNYTKSALERKKFRHYGNRLLLSRTISNDIKMLLKIFSTKHQISFR